MWSFRHMQMWADSAAAVLGDSCDVGRAVLNTTGAPLLVTRYEDLKADTEGALRKILQFVGRWAGGWVGGSSRPRGSGRGSLHVSIGAWCALVVWHKGGVLSAPGAATTTTATSASIDRCKRRR